MWCHLPTGFRRPLTLRSVALGVLMIAFFTTLIFSHVSSAAPGINRTLNFQGRLLHSNGGVVPDGYYNIQFKIYESGSGAATGNPDGTLKWTETYTNNGGTSGVQVKNGLMSVSLGSNTPFGSSIDWNQDTLWLSMNVAGSSASCISFDTSACIADGEMLPMKRLTATPYSLNSGAVGGKTADELVQLGQGAQTDTSNAASILINKTGTGNLLQLQNTARDVFTIGNTGNVMLGSNDDKSISVDVADEDSSGRNLSIAAGGGGSGSGSSGGTLTLQGGSAGGANGSGGNITLSGGNGSGTGVSGLVILGTPTFATVTDDANCYTNGVTVAANCTVTDSSVNNSSAVIVGFNTSGRSATLPNPATTTAGRIFYVMASGDSEDFTLRANVGGGVELEQTIMMRKNVSAALLWNGEAWTVTETPTAKTDFSDGNDSTATVLTLDKSTTAPADNEALLGSMYYDTTLGKVQCYESEGWGACGAAPDTFVSLSPEYSNAVMNGTDIGTISSDLCSDTLNINDGSSSQPTICNTDETYNYYNWTTAETTDQTRSIYITYQLPASFKEFIPNSTSLLGRTDHANSNVSYQLYRDNGDNGLTSCGTVVPVSTGAQTSWQKATASGSGDPASCNFEAGDSLLIRINLTARSNTNAYVSNLSFAFSNN